MYLVFVLSLTPGKGLLNPPKVPEGLKWLCYAEMSLCGAGGTAQSAEHFLCKQDLNLCPEPKETADVVTETGGSPACEPCLGT